MADTETTDPTTEEPKGRTWSASRRAAWRRRQEGKAAPRSRNGRAADVDLIAEEVVGEAVANVTTLAGFLMPIAPYTAVTVAGVPHPTEPDAWIVAPRAQMAGRVLLEHAKRDVRVLRAIDRFNRMFQSVEALEVAASVVASVAVDAHMVDPHAAIALPGGAKAPLLAPVIGDTIAYIDAENAAQNGAQQGPRMDGAAASADRTTRREGQTVVDGGVEGT